VISIIKILTFLQTKIKVLSTRLVYSVLLMLYAYQSSHTPLWAKRIILGAFAYLLSPLDSVPDLTPLLGFTDDMGVISFGLVAIACYIDADVRAKARKKIYALFKEVDETELQIVDAKL
jgi:uncharacterized membrane protein YkvA (DUF1232 family)